MEQKVEGVQYGTTIARASMTSLLDLEDTLTDE